MNEPTHFCRRSALTSICMHDQSVCNICTRLHVEAVTTKVLAWDSIPDVSRFTLQNSLARNVQCLSVLPLYYTYVPISFNKPVINK